MTALTYDLAGFPWAKAMASVQSKAMPFWQRALRTLALLGLTAPTFTSLLSSGEPIPHEVNAGLAIFCLALLVLIVTGRLYTGRCYASLADAPHRRGQWTLVMNDQGLTFSSDNLKNAYPWQSLHDVIPGPGGVLVLLTSFEMSPIPSAAFADPTELQSFIATCKSHLTPQPEVTP